MRRTDVSPICTLLCLLLVCHRQLARAPTFSEHKGKEKLFLAYKLRPQRCTRKSLAQPLPVAAPAAKEVLA